MSATRKSLAELNAKLAALPKEILDAIRPALTVSVAEIKADARALAESSRRSGGLIESIEDTAPGQTTPAYASDGGRRTALDNQAFVTAGDSSNRHAHLVEFGTDGRHHADGTPTGTMPADPFLMPAWRLNKARVERRLNRAIGVGAKMALQA